MKTLNMCAGVKDLTGVAGNTLSLQQQQNTTCVCSRMSACTLQILRDGAFCCNRIFVLRFLIDVHVCCAPL